MAQHERVKFLLDEATFPLYKSPVLNPTKDLGRGSKDFRPDCDIKSFNSFCGFIDRVLTFLPNTWSTDPNAALYFAKYGWRGATDLNIHCGTCRTTMDCSCIIQKADVWFMLAKQGHRKFCPWTFISTPDEYFKVPTDPKFVFNSMTEIWESLSTLDSNLPNVSDEIVNELGISNKTLHLFFQLVGRPVTDVGVNALVLGICGWIKSSSDKSLECSFCQRCVGLWNFHSIEDTKLCVEDSLPKPSSSSVSSEACPSQDVIPSDCEVPLEENEYISEECSEVSEECSEDEEVENGSDDLDDGTDDEIGEVSDEDCVEIVSEVNRIHKRKRMSDPDSELSSEDEAASSSHEDAIQQQDIEKQDRILLQRLNTIKLAAKIKKRLLNRNVMRAYRLGGRRLQGVQKRRPFTYMHKLAYRENGPDSDSEYEEEDIEVHVIDVEPKKCPKSLKAGYVDGKVVVMETESACANVSVPSPSKKTESIGDVNSQNMDETSGPNLGSSETNPSNCTPLEVNDTVPDSNADAPSKYCNLEEVTDVPSKKRCTNEDADVECNGENPSKRRKVEDDENKTDADCTSSDVQSGGADVSMEDGELVTKVGMNGLGESPEASNHEEALEGASSTETEIQHVKMNGPSEYSGIAESESIEQKDEEDEGICSAPSNSESQLNNELSKPSSTLVDTLDVKNEESLSVNLSSETGMKSLEEASNGMETHEAENIESDVVEDESHEVVNSADPGIESNGKDSASEACEEAGVVNKVVNHNADELPECEDSPSVDSSTFVPAGIESSTTEVNADEEVLNDVETSTAPNKDQSVNAASADIKEEVETPEDLVTIVSTASDGIEEKGSVKIDEEFKPEPEATEELCASDAGELPEDNVMNNLATEVGEKVVDAPLPADKSKGSNVKNKMQQDGDAVVEDEEVVDTQLVADKSVGSKDEDKMQQDGDAVVEDEEDVDAQLVAHKSEGSKDEDEMQKREDAVVEEDEVVDAQLVAHKSEGSKDEDEIQQDEDAVVEEDEVVIAPLVADKSEGSKDEDAMVKEDKEVVDAILVADISEGSKDEDEIQQDEDAVVEDEEVVDTPLVADKSEGGKDEMQQDEDSVEGDVVDAPLVADKSEGSKDEDEIKQDEDAVVEDEEVVDAILVADTSEGSKDEMQQDEDAVEGDDVDAPLVADTSEGSKDEDEMQQDEDAMVEEDEGGSVTETEAVMEEFEGGSVTETEAVMEEDEGESVTETEAMMDVDETFQQTEDAEACHDNSCGIESGSRKRKLSTSEEDPICDLKKFKLEMPIVKVDFHPVNEHRFWCINRLKTKNSNGVVKPGWQQVLDCLELGLVEHDSALDESEREMTSFRMRLADHLAHW